MDDCRFHQVDEFSRRNRNRRRNHSPYIDAMFDSNECLKRVTPPVCSEDAVNAPHDELHSLFCNDRHCANRAHQCSDYSSTTLRCRRFLDRHQPKPLLVTCSFDSFEGFHHDRRIQSQARGGNDCLFLPSHTFPICDRPPNVPSRRRFLNLFVSRFRRLILHHKSRPRSTLLLSLLLPLLLIVVVKSSNASSPASKSTPWQTNVTNSQSKQLAYDYTFLLPKSSSPSFSTVTPFFADFGDDFDEYIDEDDEDEKEQQINQSLFNLYSKSTVRRRNSRRQWSRSSSDELADESDAALSRRTDQNFMVSSAAMPLSRHLRHAQPYNATTLRPLTGTATPDFPQYFNVRRRALSDGNPYQPFTATEVEDYTQHCERGILFRSSPTHREGWFYAPNVTSRLGKLYYEAKREFKCFYHFLADADEHVELAFDAFSNFGKPPDCYYEYVDLYTELPEQIQQSVQSGSSSMFPIHADALAKGWAGRYCGTVPPRLRVSLHNQLALSFSSEFSESRNTTNMPFRGRYKFFKQSERYRFGERDTNALFPQCSWIIRSEELPSGIISTPTYPGVYPRDIECVYRLLGRTGERVQLTFIDMDIFFGGEHCPYDKVDVYDGEGYNCTGCARIGTFCGLRHNFTLFSSNEDLTIVFSTRDSKSQHRGFRAFYQFDTKFVRLEPGFVDPHDTSGNVTHIRGTECDVQVRSFGLEGTAGIIASPTRPNRMHQPRSDLIRCQYIIDGKDSPSRLERIVLEFEDFRFGMPGAPSCADTNHLNVVLGAPSNLLPSSGGILPDGNNKTYCDEHRPTQALMSFGPRMVLQYYSVDKNYPAYFRARYSFKRDFGITGTPAADVNSCDFLYHYTCKNELDEDCGQKLGQIRSPRHPKKYPINLNCSYTFQCEYATSCGPQRFYKHIVRAARCQRTVLLYGFGKLELCCKPNLNFAYTVQPNQELWIVFDVFAFHSSWQKYLSGLQCNEDYVEIYYVYRPSDSGRPPRERLANRYCKTTSPAPILSDPDMAAVRIRMVSNKDTGVSVGFRGRYGFRTPQLAQTRPCGGLLFGKTHGVVMSPNFPNKYPVDTKCDWRIEVAAGYKVLITINNFELEGNVQSGGCSGAAVQFFHVRPEPAYLNSSQAPYWLPDFVEWQETNLAETSDSLFGGEGSSELFKEMPLELCGPLKQSKRNRDVLMKPTFLSYDNRARITFTTAAKAVSNRGFQIAWTRVRVVPISSDKYGQSSVTNDRSRPHGQLNWPQVPENSNSEPNSVSAVIVDTPPRRGPPPPLVVSNLEANSFDSPLTNTNSEEEILVGSVLAAGLCNEADEFLCQSVNYVYCLPKATVCDGVYHCSIRTYSDERQCDYSNLQQPLLADGAFFDGTNAATSQSDDSGGSAGGTGVATRVGGALASGGQVNSGSITGGGNSAGHSMPNYTTRYIIAAVGSVLACLVVFLACLFCFKASQSKSTKNRRQQQQEQHSNNRDANTAMVANGRIGGSSSSTSIRGGGRRGEDDEPAALRSSRSTYSAQSLRQLSASPVGNRLQQPGLLLNNNNYRNNHRHRESEEEQEELVGQTATASIINSSRGIPHYAQPIHQIPPIVLNDEQPPTVSLSIMSNGATATYSAPQTTANSTAHFMSDRAAARFDPRNLANVDTQQQYQNPPYNHSIQHRAQIEQQPTPQRGNGILAYQTTRQGTKQRSDEPVWMLDSQRSPPPSSSAASQRPSTHRMTRM